MCNEQSKKPVPHVHAELIKAWADGTIIQYFNGVQGEWFDVNNNSPLWRSDTQYRAKPKTMVKKYLVVYSRNQLGCTGWHVSGRYFRDAKEFCLSHGYSESHAHIIPSSMIEVEED